MTSIPFDHPACQQVLALIPEKFHARCWIAGSAATRWPEAWEAGGDLDVWVCDLRHNESEQLRMLLHPEVMHAAVEEDIDYANGSLLVYNQDRTHILLTSLSIGDVVDQFDIACHAAAVQVGGGGRLYAHPLFSPHPTIIANPRNPKKSVERVFQFAARYQDWDALWDDPTTRETVIDAFGLVACTPQQRWMLVRNGL